MRSSRETFTPCPHSHYLTVAHKGTPLLAVNKPSDINGRLELRARRIVGDLMTSHQRQWDYQRSKARLESFTLKHIDCWYARPTGFYWLCINLDRNSQQSSTIAERKCIGLNSKHREQTYNNCRQFIRCRIDSIELEKILTEKTSFRTIFNKK